MLKVTVELVSARGRQHDKRLGTALISNIRMNDAHTQADYDFRITGAGTKRYIRRGEVCGFPRTRLLAWDLLYRTLRQAFGGRNDGVEARLLLMLRRTTQELDRLSHDGNVTYQTESSRPHVPNEIRTMLARCDPPR